MYPQSRLQCSGKKKLFKKTHLFVSLLYFLFIYRSLILVCFRANDSQVPLSCRGKNSQTNRPATTFFQFLSHSLPWYRQCEHNYIRGGWWRRRAGRDEAELISAEINNYRWILWRVSATTQCRLNGERENDTSGGGTSCLRYLRSCTAVAEDKCRLRSAFSSVNQHKCIRSILLCIASNFCFCRLFRLPVIADLRFFGEKA